MQAEQGLHLTVDLVHFGHRYAELAADVLEENLGIRCGVWGQERMRCDDTQTPRVTVCCQLRKLGLVEAVE